MKYKYLTKKQVDILLKCYYLKKLPLVAKSENTTVNKVSQIKKNALRIIRLSYSSLYMQGVNFDGKLVLEQMAKRCGLKVNELSQLINQYIVDALISEDKKYWERIKKTGDVPTAYELLDFIYDKYEVDIEEII